MSALPQPVCRAPFDAVAHEYDDVFTDSLIGRAQRNSVWRELQRAFGANDRVLEIGCGTGVDACFLAQRGTHVVACDSSVGMIEVTTRRVDKMVLQRLVDPIVLPAEQISTLRANQPFDGAFSNFGVINCVENLAALSSALAALVKPGGQVLLCWMGACCAWETAWYLAHANPKKAFRRFQRGAVVASIAKGSSVRIQYPSVRTIARTFRPEFQLEAVKGIGVAVPPSYVESFARRHPRWMELSERFDLKLAQMPGIRALADHILVRLRRRDARSGVEA
jgi:ubiquinone/menaquinone biosynthesis C-methylase UbiE